MDLPNAAANAVKTALNWKNVLTTVVLTVIVIYLISFVLSPKLQLKDASGRITGEGDIVPGWKYGLNKAK
jgi:ABC-type uncharacterized transport system permease subunit